MYPQPPDATLYWQSGNCGYEQDTFEIVGMKHVTFLPNPFLREMDKAR
jgi:hypothetical protein